MNKTEIKQNIHSLIDTIEDEGKLEQLKQVAEHIIRDKNTEWESLTSEEKKAIQEGLDDVEKGNSISYDEFKKKHFQWLLIHN